MTEFDRLWKFCTGDGTRFADVDALVAINTKMCWMLQGTSRQVGRLLWDSILMIYVLQAKTKKTSGTDTTVLLGVRQNGVCRQ